jgi:hypothetical protein
MSSNRIDYVEKVFNQFNPKLSLKLDTQLDSEVDLELGIRFEKVNRDCFKLNPEDAECNLIPLVLVGDKRRVCNYINHLNECSTEYRSKLKVKEGKLIPFKMVNIKEFAGNTNIPKNINLLCIYSEVFDESTEYIIRSKLKYIFSINHDHVNQNTKFIKTISTIYLRNGNSNMKITRINHRRNYIEQSINIFKTKFPAYSDYDEIKWSELIDLKYEPNFIKQTENNSKCNSCSICTKDTKSCNMVFYDRCKHTSCLECAGSIVSITKTCPFCRIALSINDLVLSIKYIPSFFSTLKEFINESENKSNIIQTNQISQSIIYLESEIEIQHLLNYLAKNINSTVDVLTENVLTENVLINNNIYYLASSNRYTHLLNNLTKVIVCPNNDITKNLMLNHKSYSTNYGTGNQELIIFDSK